jgi:hypothetical protein
MAQGTWTTTALSKPLTSLPLSALFLLQATWYLVVTCLMVTSPFSTYHLCLMSTHGPAGMCVGLVAHAL